MVDTHVSRAWLPRTFSVVAAATLIGGAAGVAVASVGGRAAERACPDYATTALSVRVEDARTGARIAKGAVLGVSYGGREPGTHAFEADDEIYAVFGEAGRYDVRVTKPGYRPWERHRTEANDA